MRRLALLLAVGLVAASCGDPSSEAAAPTPEGSIALESTAPATTGSATTTTPPAPTTTAPPATTSSPPTTTESPPDPGGYPEPTTAVDTWVPEIVDVLPHDPEAFTQGLVVRGNTVYESTGLNGRSTVRKVDRATGEVVASVALADELFGEGLELVGDRLIQLTWQSETALVWDVATLDQLGTFAYEGEGWGLCDDGDRLVMSNGSSRLTFRDAETFAELDSVDVILDGAQVTNLNELECVGGLVFANVWKSSQIVVIEPETGEVTAVVDASELVARAGAEGAAVLNGIAYDHERGVFLLTGKLWDAMFEVTLADG